MSYRDYDYGYEDYEQSRRSKKGMIVGIIGIVLAILAAIGLIAVLFNPNESQKRRVSYVAKGLEMYEEPEIRLDEPNGIRFRARITPELKKEVESDPNKSFGFVIAPLTYFLKADVSGNVQERDWINEFKKSNTAHLETESIRVSTKYSSDGRVLEHYIMGGIVNVLYSNVNTDFTAFAFVKTTNGEESGYRYASYPKGTTYKTQSRSLAYVTAKALNDYMVNKTHYSSEDLATMYEFIDQSADRANGLEEPILDGSKYAVTLTESAKTLTKGNEFELGVVITEKVTLPIWWMTSEASVAVVKNGKITAKGAGEATVTAVVAGEVYECKITVLESRQ